MKILVADTISDEGLALLRSHAQVDVRTGLKTEELTGIIGDYEALVVRSQTQVTAGVIHAGKKLQVIGRAGVGVDNIDVEEASRHGIIVINAPHGNTISAAEHTIALILSLARHIPRANNSLKGGAWKRNELTGTEVRGKTLGLIGLGNVGSAVARRARGLEMRVIGHDPFVSVDYARNMQVELVPFEHLLKESDFISLHVPKTSSTEGLIGPRELTLVKPTVRIINTARGGLVDEEALAKAVREKRVAGAAVDVFPVEPTTTSVLFQEDNIIVTPHLGASTAEAQITAALDVAEQIIEVFKGNPPRYSVNAPLIPQETLSVLAPFLGAAQAVGRLLRQLVEGQMSTIQINYDGEISLYNTQSLKAIVLGGLLEGIAEERVNLVNADYVAKARGLNVVEQKNANCENYVSLITAQVTTSSGVTAVAGTIMRGETHVVRVNNYWFDIVPTGGYFLFCDHRDRPGLIGAVGNITGNADINISYMHLSRLRPRGQALMILALDEPLPEAQRQQLLALPDVHSVKLVRL